MKSPRFPRVFLGNRLSLILLCPCPGEMWESHPVHKRGQMCCVGTARARDVRLETQQGSKAHPGLDWCSPSTARVCTALPLSAASLSLETTLGRLSSTRHLSQPESRRPALEGL